MNDRIGPGLRNPNIMYAPPKDQGGGKHKESRDSGPISQRVVVNKDIPLGHHNIELAKSTDKAQIVYRLGREDTASQLDAIKHGYRTVDIALGRTLGPEEKHRLSRQQMTLSFREETDEDGVNTTQYLYVHNKASNADILVFNRGYEAKDLPGSDALMRLQATSREFQSGEQDDGGVAHIENYANSTILVPLTTTTALRVEVMGTGSTMTMKAREVDKEVYDRLRERAMEREEKQRVPEKQSIKVEVEKPGDKAQIKLEAGKKYKVGRRSEDGSNQKAAEEAGFGFIEITGDHGEGQLSKEQLEVEVVGYPESPGLRVKNTGRDHVTVYDRQGRGQDKLFGRIQPNATAKRETTISVNAGLRLNCSLNSQYGLSLEPEVLPDGTVGLYVSEHP